MRSKTSVVFCVLGLLCLLMVCGSYNWSGSHEQKPVTLVCETPHAIPSQLTAHPPIMITMNSDFGSLGFPGNGSESNPYRIEELEIFGSEFVGCIGIGGSVTAYYEIRGCILSNSTAAAAIQLVAGHGLIDTCEIYDCTIGVTLGDGDYRIESSEIYNCSSAVHASSGFEMNSSEIHDCSSGGYMEFADDVVVHNCVFTDNGQIGFYGGADLILTENSFTESGVWIGDSVGFTVTDNTFHTEQTLDQLSITNSDLGTISDNVFNINSLAGLRLQGSTNLIVTGCNFVASGPSGALGIDMRGFEGMSDIVIENCNFESVDCDAAYCEAGLVVSDCDLTDGRILILDSPGAEASANRIQWGSIVVSYNCDGSLIFNNTLTGCQDHGIRIMENNTDLVVSANSMTGTKTSLRYGISIESDYVFARYNIIENFDAGIHVDDAISCEIYNNTVYGNNVGIRIAEGCSFHQIYYNILYGNSQNARDDGSNNIWDDGIMLGNYWSNVGAPGEYAVPGTAESVDRYAQPYVTGTGLPLEIIVVVSVGTVFVLLTAAIIKMRRP